MDQLPQEDRTILGLCFHGQAPELDKGAFREEWLQHPVSKLAVEAAISLARDGQEVKGISVIARGKLPREYHAEIMQISKNGFGQVSLSDAIGHSYQTYVVGKAQETAQEIVRQSQANPRDVSKWLPRITTGMVQLIKDGDTYDPRPSKQKGDLPKIFAPSLITGMGDILRGGYVSGYLMLYAGVTKQGKSTVLNSHAVDLILQSKKVVIIRTENTPRKAVAEVACAIASISYKNEVKTDTFLGTAEESPEERRQRYNDTVEWLDDYLEVYPYDWCNDERLKRIAKWSHPDAIIIDYLKDQKDLFAKRTSSQDVVGEFGDFLLVFSHEEGIWVGSAGQINDAMSKKLVKKDTSEPVIIYGTSRLGFAADELAFLKRHNTLPNTAHVRVQLDRDDGRLDTLHAIPYDPYRRILEIKQLTGVL